MVRSTEIVKRSRGNCPIFYRNLSIFTAGLYIILNFKVSLYSDRLGKAREKGDKASEKRYTEFMRHLGSHPAKKEAEAAKYKKKFFGTVFKNRRKGLYRLIDFLNQLSIIKNCFKNNTNSNEVV